MRGGQQHRSHPQPNSEVGPVIAPEAKIVAALICVGSVVATRREAIWAFIALGGLVMAAAMAVYLPIRILLKRLVIEVPFVVFALLLPIVGGGERIDVLGVSLSRAGLWGGWNILAKGTLGVAIATVLASTTAVPDLLRGLDRLHVPKLFTAIAGFMIRYADVLRGEAARMHVARISRGDNPRSCGRRRPLLQAWARCSFVPTSAANGFTWRCSRAASRARCRIWVDIGQDGATGDRCCSSRSRQWRLPRPPG